MAKHNVNLSQEEEDALAEIGIVDIEAWLKERASLHQEQKLDENFKKKTKAEKEALLNP